MRRLTPLDIAARVVIATPVTDVREVLDINDNGRLSWPDALAWLFFATVGLLGVAVFLGMVFAGVLIQGRGVPACGTQRVEEAHPEAVAEPLGAQ